MNETTLRQIKEQIDSQIGQIIRSLIKSLDKIGGQEEDDVMHISRKIGMKTAIGNIIKSMLDNNGFLRNSDDWSKEVAFWLAREEGVMMTDAHWEIINFQREYYEEYRVGPYSNRLLIKLISRKLGPEKSNKEYLYKLFPKGVMQTVKIAGIPRPVGTV